MDFPYYSWPEATLSWSTVQGSNNKRALVICEDSDVAENLPFLKKILRSVDLDFDQDIHFIPVEANLNMHLLSSPGMKAYHNLILFGIQPSQIGIIGGDRPGCTMFQFETLTCVASPRLSELNSHSEHKKQLWSALKQLFQSAPAQ